MKALDRGERLNVLEVPGTTEELQLAAEQLRDTVKTQQRILKNTEPPRKRGRLSHLLSRFCW